MSSAAAVIGALRVNFSLIGKCTYFFFVVCCFFSKISFLKKSFRNTIWVSNSLDPEQAGHFDWPDLGPNCLQRLSADYTNRQWTRCMLVNFQSGLRQWAWYGSLFISQIHRLEQGSYRQVCVKFKDFSRTSERLFSMTENLWKILIFLHVKILLSKC